MSHQAELTQVVDDFLSKKCTPDDVRDVELGGDSGPLWGEVEELGWTLPTLPEDDGGSAATFADACTIVRVAARHAAPLPLGETALLAAWMLHGSDLTSPAGQMTVAPVRRDDEVSARREGDSWLLTGTARGVPWAAAAATVVVLAPDEAAPENLRVLALEADSAPRSDRTNLAGEPRSDVKLDGAPAAAALSAPAGAEITREALFARGALLRAVTLLGALERVRDLTISYAKDRRQFGQPIGRFQAVGHQVVQIARDVALARVAVEAAVEATPDQGAPPLVEIAIAKVMCGRAARTVPRLAHQVHGAIGVTQEYALQLFTRRLWSWRDEFGTEMYWSDFLAKAALKEDMGFWELISSTGEGESP